MQFTTVCSSNHTLRHLNRCQQMLLVHNERNTEAILRQWAEVGPLALEDSKVSNTTKTLVTYYSSRRPHCSAARCCTRLYGATQGHICHSYRLPLTSSMFLAQEPSRLVNVADMRHAKAPWWRWQANHCPSTDVTPARWNTSATRLPLER